ncbi:MAG: AraC family transcriptional regulator [Fimbriimonadaceae bacterium]
MSNKRQAADFDTFVRFWILNHHSGGTVNIPPSDWAVLLYASHGALTVQSNDIAWILPANRALWINPNCSYQIISTAPVEIRSLYFSPRLKKTRSQVPLEVTSLMRELILAACERGPLNESSPTHMALIQLIEHEIELATQFPISIPLPCSPILRKLAQCAIQSNEPLSKLVKNTGFSRRTIERRMKIETRLTLGNWYRQACMLRAIVALSKGENVNEASMIAGYSEPSAFISAFKKKFGLSPSKMMPFNKKNWTS